MSAGADILCTNNVKDFLPVVDQVGIELLNADALLSRLVTLHPSKMWAAHRTTVASLTGATDRSTIAALRRAGATQTADMMHTLLKDSQPGRSGQAWRVLVAATV